QKNVTLTIYEDEVVVQGGYSLEAGTLDLNGRTLIIMGDLIHSGGMLNVNGGKLIVKGDYRIQKKEGEGYTYSNGLVKMDNAADHILVEGDFVMDSRFQHKENYLSAGTVEIKGNFIQKSTSGTGYYNFSPEGQHKVILSGSGPQSVNFEDAGTSHFNILEITNPDPSQITFNHGEPTTSNIVYSGDVLTLRDVNIGLVGLTLPMDMKLIFSEGFAFELGTGTDSHERLNLNGHTLTVEGDFIHSGSMLNINGGKLIIKGDYRLQKETDDGGYTYSNGTVKMSNETDYILIEGDFVMDSKWTHNGVCGTQGFSAGMLEIKGDFSQKSSAYSSGLVCNSQSNFQAKGTHRTLLSGLGLQQVTFEDAGASRFNILEITNPDPTQIVFSPAEPTTSNIVCDGLLTLRDLNIGQVGMKLIRDMKVVLSEGAAFGLYGETLDLNGHTLTVEGDLLQSGGMLNINGGKLIVKGDYRIQKQAENGSYTYSSGYLRMVNEADHILVQGDFIMDSRSSHKEFLTAGTLELKGDFFQKTAVDKGSGESENFLASETHKVLLSGSGPQTVFFEDAGSSDSWHSHFN
ncbi:MAG: hypothetical protein D3907_14465, partial [Candidatus Electrothrix sp. AUS3]|nr:hypothetical protein [Candidatus Electrothrix gigas]